MRNTGIDHRSLAEAAFKKVLPANPPVKIRCVLEQGAAGGSQFFNIEAICENGWIFWGGADVRWDGSSVDARITMYKEPDATIVLARMEGHEECH